MWNRTEHQTRTLRRKHHRAQCETEGRQVTTLNATNSYVHFDGSLACPPIQPQSCGYHFGAKTLEEADQLSEERDRKLILEYEMVEASKIGQASPTENVNVLREPIVDLAVGGFKCSSVSCEAPSENTKRDSHVPTCVLEENTAQKDGQGDEQKDGGQHLLGEKGAINLEKPPRRLSEKTSPQYVQKDYGADHFLKECISMVEALKTSVLCHYQEKERELVTKPKPETFYKLRKGPCPLRNSPLIQLLRISISLFYFFRPTVEQPPLPT